MLNNKKTSTIAFKNIFLSPFNSYKRSWHVQIKPAYSLIMILGIVICAVAANWQYAKAQYYTQPLAQQVHMNGHYLNQFTQYLDNQTANGQVGYAVITPFQYEQTIYLVNRGFVAYQNREQLPKVSSIMGQVQLEGVMRDNLKPLLLNTSLQDPIEKRIQFIDSAAFSKLVGQPVFDKVLLLQKGDGVLTIQPQPEAYLSEHKHLAYALQWILLSFAGLVILTLSSIRKGALVV